MNFYCDEQLEFKSFIVNTDDAFKFIFDSEPNSDLIYLSFYQIILEDTTNSYLSSLSDNRIIRTNNGLEQCDNANYENQCLLG